MATLVYIICQLICLYVGEWSRREWTSSTFIHGRQVALSLVVRQWRSRVGRWLPQSSHSTAEQWTTTTTQLSSEAAVPRTTELQRTHVTTLRSTRQHSTAVSRGRRVTSRCSIYTKWPTHHCFTPTRCTGWIIKKCPQLCSDVVQLNSRIQTKRNGSFFKEQS